MSIERRASPDLLPSIEQPHPNDTLIASAIEYASIDSPEQLILSLLPKLSHFTKADKNQLARTIDFGMKSHAHQKRKLRETQAPFFVHPLGVAHLVTDFYGVNTTLEKLQTALLHDTGEEGKRDNRDINMQDLLEFGDTVAFGVNALTNDTGDASEYYDKIGKETLIYYKHLDITSRAHSDLGLRPMKVLDRVINLVDPGKKLSDKAREKRIKKIADTESRFMDTLLSDPQDHELKQILERGLQVSKKTVEDPTFDATRLAAKIRARTS